MNFTRVALDNTLSEASLLSLGLANHEMSVSGLIKFDFASAGKLESLLCTAVGFLFHTNRR